MRILLVSWFLRREGGAEAYVESLIPALLAEGHQVALLHGEADAPAGRSIVGCAPIPLLRHVPGAIADTLLGITKWNPDIVYVQGLRDMELEGALLDHFRVVMFGHNYYGTCATGTKRFAFPAIEACERSFGPMCLLMHYPRRCGGLSPLTMLNDYRLQGRRHQHLPRYAAVVVASRRMATEYSRNGVELARVHLVPMLIQTSRDQESPKPRNPGGRLLMVSRLTANKGGQYLLRAIPLAERKLGRPLELTIAGDGAERPRLEALAHELGLKAAFVGWVDSAQRTQLMRAADLLVIPSVWPEPFGLVGLEAGCVGVPAVAYAHGGVVDWLSEGESGELAPAAPPTSEGLAAAIVRALGDPHHYQRLCHGAWSAAGRFDSAAHMTKLNNVFSLVMNNRSTPTTPQSSGHNG